MALLVNTPIGAAPSTPKEMLLTSFDTQSPDLAWRVVNDGVMGGAFQQRLYRGGRSSRVQRSDQYQRWGALPPFVAA